MGGDLLGGVIDFRSSRLQLHGIFQMVPPRSNLPLWTWPLWGLEGGPPSSLSPFIKGRGFKSGRIMGWEVGHGGLRQGSTAAKLGMHMHVKT